MTLGERLRALRTERHHSLSHVAKETGISTSFLSFVETGKGDITIGRLMRLVKFYGVSLSDLLPEPASNDPMIVRKEHQRTIRYPAERITVSLLAPDSRRAMLPVMIAFAPHGKQAEHTTHEGDEFVHILEGAMTVEVDGKEVVLGAGDSLYFYSDMPHTYRNAGTKRARFISVTSPPSMHGQ